MVQRNKIKIVSWLLVTVLLISSYIPIIPIGKGIDTDIASAAVSLLPSTVDTNTLLSVSPSLVGDATWYYDGTTDIIDNSSGQLLGQAYRYRTSSAVISNEFKSDM